MLWLDSSLGHLSPIQPRCPACNPWQLSVASRCDHAHAATHCQMHMRLFAARAKQLHVASPSQRQSPIDKDGGCACVLRLSDTAAAGGAALRRCCCCWSLLVGLAPGATLPNSQLPRSAVVDNWRGKCHPRCGGEAMVCYVILQARDGSNPWRGRSTPLAPHLCAAFASTPKPWSG